MDIIETRPALLTIAMRIYYKGTSPRKFLDDMKNYMVETLAGRPLSRRDYNRQTLGFTLDMYLSASDEIIIRGPYILHTGKRSLMQPCLCTPRVQ